LQSVFHNPFASAMGAACMVVWGTISLSAVGSGFSHQGSYLSGFWAVEMTWELMISDQGLIFGCSSSHLQQQGRQNFKIF
jgi:hypothetical protein